MGEIKHSIYTLTNPIDKKVFYVGCTIGLENRLRHHIQVAKSGIPDSKDLKILEIIQSGSLPMIEEIETVYNESDAYKIEKYWIEQMIEWGFCLLNIKHGKTKARETLKWDKMCLVCGNYFFGTHGAQTCSVRCRTSLSRLKKAGKRPEYILIAKGKGQKIPDLNAPKGLRFKKGEKKKKQDLEILDSKIGYKTPPLESYDAEKMDIIKHDESGQWQEVEVKPLTEIEKLTKIGELERSLNAVDRETMPVGMMPKMFGLIKADKKKEIQEQINKLKQLNNGN